MAKAKEKDTATATHGISTPYGSGVLIKFASSVYIQSDNFEFVAGQVYDVCESSAARWEKRSLATRVDNSTDN